MKTIGIVSVTLILAPALFAGETKTFREHIVEEDLFFIEAESPDTTVMTMTGLFPARYPKALVKYCEGIGGTATVEKTNDYDIDNPNFKDVICTALEGKGFEARFMKPGKTFLANEYLKDPKEDTKYRHVTMIKQNDFYLRIKHEQPQTDSHARKGWYKEKSIDTKKLDEINGMSSGAAFNAEDLSAWCHYHGGKYLMSTEDTQGYAVDYNSYLLNIVNGVGDFTTRKSPGRHWCIDTVDKADEFSAITQLNRWRDGIYFVVTRGVDRSQIKISTDPNPPYLFKSKKPIEADEQTEVPESDLSIQSSRQPLPAETDLAKRTLASKNTTLARTGGYVSEGMYLGANDQGCERAAVARTGDNPVNHKSFYGNAAQYQWVMNFRQCGGGKVEFIGESVERTFPRSIEPEYKRVLGLCKIKGMAMGTYLGYDIDCQRQGSMVEPVYEMTIVKKDKLIGRAYDK